VSHYNPFLHFITLLDFSLYNSILVLGFIVTMVVLICKSYPTFQFTIQTYCISFVYNCFWVHYQFCFGLLFSVY